VLGDASNAYGKEVSPLWLERGKEGGIEYTPANGWDENHLKTFRRHTVALGKSGLMFIYDELELKPEDRKLPSEILLPNEAITAFEAWAAKEDKIEY